MQVPNVRDRRLGFQCICLSPDSKKAACGLSEGYLSIWDTATGLCDVTLRLLDSSSIFKRLVPQADGSDILRQPVQAITFSPDGSMMAVGHGKLHLATLWDASTGQLLHVLTPKDADVNLKQRHGFMSLQFSEDGRLLVGAGGLAVLVWDMATRTQLHSFDFQGTVGELLGELNPDMAFIFNARFMQGAHDRHEARMRVYACFIPGSSSLAITTVTHKQDGEACVYVYDDVATWHEEPQQERAPSRVLYLPKQPTSGGEEDTQQRCECLAGLAVSPDGRHLASLDTEGGCRMYVWDIATGACTDTGNIWVKKLDMDDTLGGPVFSSDGSSVMLVDNSGLGSFIRVWDLRSGAWIDKVTIQQGADMSTVQTGNGRGLCLSADGSYLAAVSTSRIRFWSSQRLRDHYLATSSAAASNSTEANASGAAAAEGHTGLCLDSVISHDNRYLYIVAVAWMASGCGTSIHARAWPRDLRTAR